MNTPSKTPIMPQPYVLVRDDQGVTSWRPVMTELSVHGVAQDHTVRHVVIREDGEERYRFKLDAAQATHLARLLSPSVAEKAA